MVGIPWNVSIGRKEGPLLIRRIITIPWNVSIGRKEGPLLIRRIITIPWNVSIGRKEGPLLIRRIITIPWNVSIGRKGGSLTTTVNPLTDTTAIPWNVSMDGQMDGFPHQINQQMNVIRRLRRNTLSDAVDNPYDHNQIRKTE